MKLYIKNMVCDRCIMVVRNELNDMDFAYSNIQLGEVELASEPPTAKLGRLRENLAALGFEILDDRKSALINQIKSTIITLIHSTDSEELNRKISVILAEKLGKEYHYLSGLFSSIEGVTIEKYMILQRIERAKELLIYDQMTLNEISYSLGYSSVQHLSLQFKKVTGMTPTQFKNLSGKSRIPLDKL